MICDFGGFTRRGLLTDLERPAEILWGHIADRGRDRRGDVVDNKTIDLPAVRECEAERFSLTTGDTNDPKCLGFHSVKPRKVRGRRNSPERRAVL